MNAVSRRRLWEATRLEHHIAARKALGAYIAATTEIRAADLRRSQEVAQSARGFLAGMARARAA